MLGWQVFSSRQNKAPRRNERLYHKALKKARSGNHLPYRLDVIDFALAAGNTDHLALYFSFEFFRIDIKSRTFVKTWEQKFGLFGNLEGNGSLFGLNSD